MSGFGGQTVPATGAGSGVGHLMARRFRDEGARVDAGDVRPGRVPQGTTASRLDVTDSVAAAVAPDTTRQGR